MGLRTHDGLSLGARILRPSVIRGKLRVWSEICAAGKGVGVVSGCGGGSKKFYYRPKVCGFSTLILLRISITLS
jgi:hypothetical protein